MSCAGDSADRGLAGAEVSAEITREQWLKALAEAEPTPDNDPNTLTRAELCEVFGLAKSAVGERMARMVKAGKAIRTTKVIVDGAGRRLRVSAYRLVEK